MTSGHGQESGRGHQRQGPPKKRHLHAHAAKRRHVRRAAATHLASSSTAHRGHRHWVAISLLLLGVVLAIVGGVCLWGWANARPEADTQPGAVNGPAATEPDEAAAPADLEEARDHPDALPPAVAYEPKDNTLDIEISEYAGYVGLILANGGQLEPNDNSIFAKKYGFRVRLKTSESEDWGPIQTGKLAASTTTVDVLAAYGKGFDVVVPAQIGYSAGADSIVVRSDIHTVYDLKGKTLVVPQFTEADFLVRYLVSQAGLGVNPVDSLDPSGLSANAVNLVFTGSVDDAQKILSEAVDRGDERVSGALVWSPFDVEVVEKYPKKVSVLTTSRDVALVADVLIVNKGFAAKHATMVDGLAAGLLAGNTLARSDPSKARAALCKAFDWSDEEAAHHLGNIRLADTTDNLAFFTPDTKRANNYGGIYRAATALYYGEKAPNDGSLFLWAAARKNPKTAPPTTQP